MSFKNDPVSRRTALKYAGALGVAAGAAAQLRAASAQDATPEATAVEYPAPTAYTPAGPQVEKLVLWTRSSPDSSPNEFNALQEVAAKYTEYTGTAVELVTVPDGDFRSRLSLAAPGGDGPDIFGPVAHDWIGEVALQGIAAPFTTDDLVGFEDIPQSTIDAVTYNGQMYGYPLMSESLILFHNNDIVAEAPATWDDLVTKATEATHDDVYGFGFQAVEPYYLGAFFHGFGSYIFKNNDGTLDYDDIGLNNEGGVEAAKFVRDMVANQVPPIPEDVLDQPNAGGFLDGIEDAGLLGMRINGPWREPGLQTAGVNYGVAKLPTLPNGNPLQPFSGIQVMEMNAFGEQQDAAKDLINYFGSSEAVAILVAGFNKPPVHMSLRDAAVEVNPNLAVVMDQVVDAVPMPNIPQMAQVWTPWGDAVLGIVSGNVSDDEVQSMLDTAVEQIKANIAAN
ncbi:MAG: extracellular solute-binding protein [Thermomicrobiales bacterium]|nr:extracellular solute-binding protein [Thermomicrobiales bacterium]